MLLGARVDATHISIFSVGDTSGRFLVIERSRQPARRVTVQQAVLVLHRVLLFSSRELHGDNGTGLCATCSTSMTIAATVPSWNG